MVIKQFIPGFAKKFIKKRKKEIKSFFEYKKILEATPSYNNAKLRIAFIVQRTEIFNSVKTVFDAANSNDKIEAYLIALPPNRGHQNWKTIDYSDTSVNDFCLEKTKNTVIPYDINGNIRCDWIEYKFDFIFLNVPYTALYPVEFHISKLALHTKVCYIPYAYILQARFLRDIYTDEFVANIRYIFVENKLSYKYCKKRFFLSEIFFGKRIYNYGFPRFDLIEKKAKKDIPNTILWIPRWTTSNDSNDGNISSSFLKYKDAFITYSKKMPNIKFIIRPHPLMFSNYIEQGVMSEKEVNDYKLQIAQTSNIFLDENDTYSYSFKESDILLADFSSIVIEYFYLGKPVIYLGDKKSLINNKLIYSTFYKCSNWKEIEGIIKKLMNSQDDKKKKREKILSKYKTNGSIGKQIINQLLNNYYKEQ